MTCPSGHDNPIGNQFCATCGQRLTAVPPPGAAAPPGAEVVPGARPAGAAGASASPPPPPPPSPGATPLGVGPGSTGRRRRTVALILAPVVALALVVGSVVVVRTVLGSGETGPLLVERMTSSGRTSLYFLERDGEEYQRGARVADGSLLWPTQAATGLPAPSAVFDWQGEDAVAVAGDDEIVIMTLDADAGTATEAAVVDGAWAEVSLYPDGGPVVVGAEGEPGTCALLVPGARPVEADGECVAGLTRVTAIDQSDESVDVTVWDVAGDELFAGSFDVAAGTAAVAGDGRWLAGVEVTDDALEVVRVYDLGDGSLIHEGVGALSAYVLATSSAEPGVVYAEDAGEESLLLHHVQPDGSERTLGQAGQATATLSPDGGTAWYATADVDADDWTVFRVAAGSDEPVDVGRGDNVLLRYVGAPVDRLLAFAGSNEATEVLAAGEGGELEVVGDVPGAALAGLAVDEATGDVYVSVYTSDSSEDAAPAGAVLRLAKGAEEMDVLGEEYDTWASTIGVTVGPDRSVLIAGSEGRDQVLTRWVGGEDERLADAPTLRSVFATEDAVYYSTADEDGTRVAAWRIGTEGDDPAERVASDLAWAAVPGARAPLRVSSWDLSWSVEAVVDPTLARCREEGLPLVEVLSGESALSERRSCVRVPEYGEVNLTVDAYGTDVVMDVLTVDEQGGETSVAYDDDQGLDFNPFVTTSLDEGAYIVEVSSYSGSDDPFDYLLMGCFDDSAGAGCAAFQDAHAG